MNMSNGPRALRSSRVVGVGCALGCAALAALAQTPSPAPSSPSKNSPGAPATAGASPSAKTGSNPASSKTARGAARPRVAAPLHGERGRDPRPAAAGRLLGGLHEALDARGRLGEDVRERRPRVRRRGPRGADRDGSRGPPRHDVQARGQRRALSADGAGEGGRVRSGRPGDQARARERRDRPRPRARVRERSREGQEGRRGQPRAAADLLRRLRRDPPRLPRRAALREDRRLVARVRDEHELGPHPRSGGRNPLPPLPRRMDPGAGPEERPVDRDEEAPEGPQEAAEGRRVGPGDEERAGQDDRGGPEGLRLRDAGRARPHEGPARPSRRSPGRSSRGSRTRRTRSSSTRPRAASTSSRPAAGSRRPSSRDPGRPPRRASRRTSRRSRRRTRRPPSSRPSRARARRRTRSSSPRSRASGSWTARWRSRRSPTTASRSSSRSKGPRSRRRPTRRTTSSRSGRTTTPATRASGSRRPAGPSLLRARTDPGRSRTPFRRRSTRFRPTSPKYNVTYVTVVESTPETVTDAYTSGYEGEVVSSGVVMYGVGYAYGYGWGYPWYYSPYYWGWGMYPPYYGGITFWAGAYGYGWSAYGPYGGAGYGARYNPATGVYSRGGYAYGPGGAAAWRAGYNPSTGVAGAQRGGANAYGSWKQGMVTNGSDWVRGGSVSNSQGTLRGFQTSGGAAGNRRLGKPGLRASSSRTARGTSTRGTTGTCTRGIRTGTGRVPRGAPRRRTARRLDDGSPSREGRGNARQPEPRHQQPAVRQRPRVLLLLGPLLRRRRPFDRRGRAQAIGRIRASRRAPTSCPG